jgi:hypothetical protein
MFNNEVPVGWFSTSMHITPMFMTSENVVIIRCKKGDILGLCG